ncbi:unnamed protein product [Calypogeia fissa]
MRESRTRESAIAPVLPENGVKISWGIMDDGRLRSGRCQTGPRQAGIESGPAEYKRTNAKLKRMNRDTYECKPRGSREQRPNKRQSVVLDGSTKPGQRGLPNAKLVRPCSDTFLAEIEVGLAKSRETEKTKRKKREPGGKRRKGGRSYTKVCARWSLLSTMSGRDKRNAHARERESVLSVSHINPYSSYYCWGRLLSCRVKHSVKNRLGVASGVGFQARIAAFSTRFKARSGFRTSRCPGSGAVDRQLSRVFSKKLPPLFDIAFTISPPTRSFNELVVSREWRATSRPWLGLGVRVRVGTD